MSITSHALPTRSPLCSTSCDVGVEGKILFTAGIRILRYPLTGTASIAQITYSSLIAYISFCSSCSSPQVHGKSRTPQRVMIYACVRHYAAPGPALA